MTKERLEILSAKIMQQKQGDKREAVASLLAACDAFLSLGQHEQAERAQKVLAYVRSNY